MMHHVGIMSTSRPYAAAALQGTCPRAPTAMTSRWASSCAEWSCWLLWLHSLVTSCSAAFVDNIMMSALTGTCQSLPILCHQPACVPIAMLVTQLSSAATNPHAVSVRAQLAARSLLYVRTRLTTLPCAPAGASVMQSSQNSGQAPSTAIVQLHVDLTSGMHPSEAEHLLRQVAMMANASPELQGGAIMPLQVGQESMLVVPVRALLGVLQQWQERHGARVWPGLLHVALGMQCAGM